MAEHELQPIFRPLRAKFQPFGIPAGKFLGIIGVAFIGVVLAVATGNITHVVERPYDNDDLFNLELEYRNLQKSLNNIEAERVAGNYESYSDMKLDADQKDTIKECQKRGIQGDMSRKQLDALIPETHMVTEPVMPGPFRAILFVALPVIALVSLHMEINRTSLWKELKRAIAYAKSQKEYRSRPISFVERECEMPYLSAVAAVMDEEHGRTS